MQQRTDKLNGWEKAAIFATGAGGAFNILLYQLGFALSDATPGSPWLWGARVFFAVVSFVGFDLTLGVTVMAMRAGRRSRWAGATVALAMLAAGGIALDVSAVWLQPWMHAAPVIVLGAFLLHLAAPPVAQRASVLAAQLAQRETELAQAQIDMDQRDTGLAHLRRDLEQARAAADQLADQGGAQVQQLQVQLAHVTARAAQAERIAAQARAEMEQRQLEDGAERIMLNGRAVSLRHIARITGASLSTLRRKLAEEGAD